MEELEILMASRAFVTVMLAGLGFAIAFGPEVRDAFVRMRQAEAPDSEDLSPARASAR